MNNLQTENYYLDFYKVKILFLSFKYFIKWNTNQSGYRTTNDWNCSLFLFILGIDFIGKQYPILRPKTLGTAEVLATETTIV